MTGVKQRQQENKLMASKYSTKYLRLVPAYIWSRNRHRCWGWSHWFRGWQRSSRRLCGVQRRTGCCRLRSRKVAWSWSHRFRCWQRSSRRLCGFQRWTGCCRLRSRKVGWLPKSKVKDAFLTSIFIPSTQQI
jgi:hypothetical protein